MRWMEESIAMCINEVCDLLDHLRGPSTEPSEEAMRVEQYLTQAESFLRQAYRKLRE